ncbi:NFACT RNA binding domain-containing protein [Dyadobacter jejuensis]|uniref:NFACT RNA binding domain-containing protein n=1 Tax=Dyadobacter jejuensis TaxID=1082580 RepID=UPI001E430D93|nr:NFACT RNA binding domain-containing protein [Dyadobacter jejuensis]
MAPKLHQQLSGKYFIEAFSQEKNELLVVFGDGPDGDTLTHPFFIKATFRPDFSCLSFPEKFDRARRNSVNLFNEFKNQRIERVRVCLNERALRFDCDSGAVLVFKLFGNRSNIVGFSNQGNVTSLFNNRLIADQNIQLGALDRPLEQDYEAFLQSDRQLKSLFPTFGKLVNAVLKKRLAGIPDPLQQWQVVQNLLAEMEQGHYYIYDVDMVPTFSLIALPEAGEGVHYDDPLEGLNQFYYRQVRLNGIDKEKGEIVRVIKKRIVQTENYLENTFEKLVRLEEGVKNEEIGHILMANLHQIPPRTEQVELYDFYRDQPIKIKLKKDWSPQKNAEGYYRKSKNEKIELDRLNDSIMHRQGELEKLQRQLEEINEIDMLRALRTYIKNEQLLTGKVHTADEVELFKKVEFMGFTILIGRNAKNNDLLTKQYAFKEDLWLHARDVSGSHVVIKYQPGKNFPEPVIERAAEIAAYHSKRKSDSLCPVIVTPKKYVRKPKGMPDGAVVLDKEKVVLVVPKP